MMKRFLFLCLLCGQAMAQIEPTAGNWKTWVISSGKDYRLPPPPDKRATEGEIKEMVALQSRMDAESARQVQYWNAGAPGYRWQQIAAKLSKGASVHPFRTYPLLHVAIYDATIAAWDTKYAFSRPRPSKATGGVKALIPVPDSPAYPSEHAVAAGAAAAVLSYVFPQKADSLQNLARQAAASRVLAGVQYPSDAEAGLQLGRKVAEQVIARAKNDGWDRKWTGTMPTQAGLWTGPNPFGITYGSLKPWVLDSANQFLPAAPPDFAKEMQELRAFKPTPQSNTRFYHHASTDEWFDITDTKLFEYNLTANPPRAARVYVLQKIAYYDAIIACFDAKYAYWGIRPYQYDTTFRHVLGRPPFPGYPSAHAATSSTVANVLAYLFPADAAYFRQVAEECAESRFEGGLHFRTDNEVGLDMGRKVAERIIRRASEDGADRPPGLVRK